MDHFVLLPNQRQRPGKQDCDQKQHADHGQWKPDVVLAIEQDPCRQDEQGDEADCGLVDVGVKLIENGSIVMGKFPSHEKMPSALGTGLAAPRGKPAIRGLQVARLLVSDCAMHAPGAG